MKEIWKYGNLGRLGMDKNYEKEVQLPDFVRNNK